MWLIILIIFIIVGGITGIIMFDDCDSKIVNFLTGGVALGIIAGIILITLFVVSTFFAEISQEYEIEQYKIQGLESNLNTTQNTNGAFVLGFGYMNSKSSDEMKYYYFKVDEIGKKLQTIEITNYSNTYIRETDEVEPCLIYRYQETKKQGFWKWLFGDSIEKYEIAQILVVPTDTIKIEYNVDI